jgi:hypothetical protein
MMSTISIASLNGMRCCGFWRFSVLRGFDIASPAFRWMRLLDVFAVVLIAKPEHWRMVQRAALRCRPVATFASHHCATIATRTRGCFLSQFFLEH